MNKQFDFNKLKATLPYLSELGISHVYASPIFTARPGSTHGYDATDTNQINDALGGSGAFDALLRVAADLGLEWIQDIVPNHIAYWPQSTMVSDVMKFGSNSAYQGFLDVDWNHPSPRLQGKILAPFLAEPYETCLRQRQICLAYHDGFQIRYGDLEFPVRISSYRTILSQSTHILDLPFQDEKNFASSIQKNYSSDEFLRSEIEKALNRHNGDTDLLDALLSEQVYALAYWKTAFEEINYRRFFDIIDLICLRMEEKDAFETTHQLILKLVSEGKATGLRVDHVDGLFDPEQYLKWLREAAPQTYIIVEKILFCDEKLPESWPVQGTTGYDFLNELNGLFVEKKNKATMSAVYREFSGNKKSFRDLLIDCKKSVIRNYFGGDLDNLTRQLHQVLKSRPYGEKCTMQSLREAVIEMLSAFSVYRTYISNDNVADKQRAAFKYCLQAAKKQNRKTASDLATIETLLGDATSSADALQFFMRLQQFSGPIMAKGLEGYGALHLHSPAVPQ